MVIMIRRNGRWDSCVNQWPVLDISGNSTSAFRQEAEWNSGVCIVLLQNRRSSNRVIKSTLLGILDNMTPSF